MTIVQLAIHDSEYAQALRNLLLRDGTHRVLLVERPDLKTSGVIVTESDRVQDLSLLGDEPERFVVITHKSQDHLMRIWEAGVRHVVFEEDSPTTAQLAVIAAELRIPKNIPGSPVPGNAGGTDSSEFQLRCTKKNHRGSTLGVVLDRQPKASHCWLCPHWTILT